MPRPDDGYEHAATPAEPQPSRPAATHRAGVLASVERHATAGVIVLVCLWSFLAYANALTGQFVFDDIEQIVQNPTLRSWENLHAAFTTHVWAFRDQAPGALVPPPLPYYRPLFTLLLTIEYHLFGLWPPAWHLVSLLLHIGCSILVFQVTRLVCAQRLVALVTALLFTVHPIHAQSVAWISGMTDPLFAVFFLASFYFYLAARAGDGDSAPAAGGGTHRSAAKLTVSVLLFVVAAFCKETALSLVLLVFCYEIIGSAGTSGSRLARAARRAAPFLAAAFVYLIPRYLVLGELMWTNPQAPARPLAATVLTLPLVICSYLSHLVWPVGLSLTYATRFVTSPTSASFIVPTAVLLGVVGAAVAFRKQASPDVWFATALLVVPLLPVLRLGQVSREEYLVFDHYLYVSAAGWSCLVALLILRAGKAAAGIRIQRGWTPLNPGFIAVALLLFASTLVCASENRSWADAHALWSRVVRVRPDYWSGHYNQGLALLEANQFAAARQALERAAQLNPDEAYIFAALGRADDGLGDLAAAIADYRRALALNPRQLESLNNLGVLYIRGGDYAEAERSLRRALELDAASVGTRSNLAVCYLQQGKYAEAAREFEQLVGATASDALVYYQLGIAYEGAGRHGDAAGALALARQLSTSPELNDAVAEALERIRQRAQ